MNIVTMVQSIIGKQLKRSPDGIPLTADLRKDLAVDSLDVLEILTDLEETFHIEISDDEARTAVRVQDIVNFIQSKVKVCEGAR